ncbi:peptidoglycan-binding protein [Kovacikia minuta CCNUW1]|uniref:peptidoglycan-binding protein n=1 Tax=Kovacikia minuta TaxID=2931930 RepID=UPI001CCDA770|nr:peptidoglycan-binding protein [Kovacikia minuta]UBF29125.1 peptidoglycan-binding protein [Kovacikia minuta CCNUW1]
MVKVKDVIDAGDTGLIRGLSLQIIAVMNMLVPNALVNFDDLNVDITGNQINPYLQPAAKESLRIAIKERGRTLFVNSAYRTVAQQFLIRQQFERGLFGITAAALPGSSNHEGGLALDVEDPDGWQPFFERHNWIRLGRDFDFPHFDYRFLAATRQDLGRIGIRAFQRLWNQYNPGDRIAEDGSFGPQTAARLANSPANGFGVVFNRALRLQTPPLQGDDVTRLQQALINAKITKIEISVTGIFDATTDKAVKQFQDATKRLSVDGIVGPATLTALGL